MSSRVCPASSPVAAGGNPTAIASPAGKFAHVTNNATDNVSAFTIGATSRDGS